MLFKNSLNFELREAFLCSLVLFLCVLFVLQDESKILKLKKRNAGKVFVKCSVRSQAQKPLPEVRIGVLGASGYTGSEVVFSSLELKYLLLEEICL